jgi:adenosylcobinamide-phosphate synthase
LKTQGLEAGRKAVAHIVGRDVRRLDAHGVARAAIESCAENYSDAVVAPTFWYVLFGFPGLLVYKAVNTTDSMIGYRSPRYRAFGMAAARTDDAANFLPARLAGVFLCTAALFVPTARPVAGLRTMLRDAGNHRSVNAGWPEGAAAGALGLALAGPRTYTDSVIDDAWIGDGRAKATPRDIDRALYLYAVACLINAFVVAGLVTARLSF